MVVFRRFGSPNGKFGNQILGNLKFGFMQVERGGFRWLVASTPHLLVNGCTGNPWKSPRNVYNWNEL